MISIPFYSPTSIIQKEDQKFHTTFNIESKNGSRGLQKFHLIMRHQFLMLRLDPEQCRRELNANENSFAISDIDQRWTFN
jgi:hypothetical protein